MCTFALNVFVFISSYLFVNTSFELSPDDENYDQLIQVNPDRLEGEPLKYYAEYAGKMAQNEEKTMYINFSHLSNFPHEDVLFIENIV